MVYSWKGKSKNFNAGGGLHHVYRKPYKESTKLDCLGRLQDTKPVYKSVVYLHTKKCNPKLKLIKHAIYK